MKKKKFKKRRSLRKRYNFGRIRFVFMWIAKISVVCLFAFVFVWYFGQKVCVSGDSMNPVLENGDMTMINRIVYDASMPKRGDIIAFKPKGNEHAHYYIKRIIGLPSETVEIKDGSIYINGEKLKEEYETTKIEDPGIADEKITLAGDEFFVLGDDRRNSEDSRMADVGNVKRAHIYGKVWFVLSPAKHAGFVKSR